MILIASGMRPRALVDLVGRRPTLIRQSCTFIESRMASRRRSAYRARTPGLALASARERRNPFLFVSERRALQRVRLPAEDRPGLSLREPFDSNTRQKQIPLARLRLCPRVGSDSGAKPSTSFYGVSRLGESHPTL